MAITSRLPFPGHHAPDAGFEAPYAMLEACHERIERYLQLLPKLRAHLRAHGWTADAASAARDVRRYFDIAGPQHHLDEELHVFPAAFDSDDALVRSAVQQLQQDHIAMERAWAEARVPLGRIAGGSAADWLPLTAREDDVLDRFVALYDRHIDTEQGLVFPAARRLMSAAAEAEMGRDMMERRGATPG